MFHFMRTLILCLILAAFSGSWAQDLEPLPPEEAFRVTVAAEPEQIVLEWTLEPGYYLYKKRFAFETAAEGISLGEPEYPEGQIHEDEFFGRSVIFRDTFTVRIPYERGPATASDLDLSIRSQGCADLGLCYPPQTWIRPVRLPEQAKEGGNELLSLITSGGGGAEEDFLPPDQAFRFTAEVVNPGWVEANWQIADGYYLYRHSLGFEALGEGQSVGEPLIPDGKRKQDEFFGEVEVYYRELSVRVPVMARAGEMLELEARYQGCAEDGICYPPMTQQVSLALSDAPVSASAAGPGPVSEQDRLAGLIRDGSLPWVAAVFFGFGLLLAFTPCVLPMVPILSSIIVGQGPAIGVRRAFTLSLAFVLAMSLTYTVAGVVVALLGQNLQAAFQHPLILVGFSAIFVALALAMFGVYELQVPAALQSRLTAVSQKQASGTLTGAGVMGILSALIVGPCVAAPLAAALIVIGQSGDAFRGGAALFALSLGMGTPLLAFGASAGKLLPKAGPWMEIVKKFFGLLLLGVAIWMIERIVPPALSMVLWGILVLGTGVLMGAFRSGREGSQRTGRGRVAGIAVIVYGLAIIVGAATGATSPLRPLEGIGQSAESRAGLDFDYIKTVDDLDSELSAASAEGRLVMLDFYADWCVDCKKMDRYTFTEPSVAAALDSFRLLKADVTANDAEDQALLRRFGIFGPPTIAFFGTDGVENRAFRQVGFAPASEFAAHVEGFKRSAKP
jgi:thiol:disulfide interchange protein DsbD